MASYPPPSQNVPIFNPSDFETGNTSLTLTTADARYLQLSGGVERGLVTFQAGLATSSISNSGNTFTVPSSSGQLALVSQIPSPSSFVDLTTPQTITGAKTFTNLIFADSTDTTKQVKWNIASSSASTLLTLASNQTTSQILNYPNITGTDTLAVLGLTQTFSTTKNFTGGSGISTTGTYPRTSASNQQSSTFTTPAIQIGGNTNDGIYSSGTDIVDIGTQGTNYISLQPQGIYRFVGGTIDPAIVFNQRIQAYNGANGAASPGIQIDNQNSGFYRVNQGTIGIGISGVATARWSSAGLNIFGVAGTAGAPALVLANDTTSGLYRPSANQVAVSCSGAQVGNFTSTGLAITGALSATTTINSAAGTALLPSLYFSTDTTSGIYRPAANQVAIACSAAQVGNFTSTGLAITGSITASTIVGTNSGTAGAPSFYFTTDTTTGFFRSSASVIGVACGGSNTGTFGGGGFTSNFAIAAQTGFSTGNAGNATTPMFYMAGDSTTGIYRPAANQLAITCSGAQVANFTSSGAAITGAITATSVNVSSSTTITQVAFGSWTKSMTINAGTTSTFSDTFSTAFSSTPSSVQITLRSTGGINALIASIDSYNTTTLNYRVYNSSGSNFTTSTVNVEYIAFR